MNRLLCLLLVLLAGCTAPLPLPRGTPPAAENVAAAMRVQQSLAAQRAHFLATGEPDEVFAVFYYHSTQAIREQVLAGAVPHGDIVLEMLAEFHRAWAHSRGLPHWQPYYKQAARLRCGGLTWRGIAHPLDALHPRGLGTLGAIAHIDRYRHIRSPSRSRSG